MNEKIIEGLKKLDPKVDAHWNQDGQVNLNAFKFIMNGEAVTREQIEEVAPNFRRDNTVIGESETTEGETTASSTAGEKADVDPTKVDSDINTENLTKVETVEGTYDPAADPSLAVHDNGTVNDAIGPKTVLGGDSSYGQPGTGTLENQMGGTEEKKLNELTVKVQVTLESALADLLGLVEDKKVISDLSDEELAELRAQVPTLRGKAVEVQDAVAQIVATHIQYLDAVIREADSRTPSETLQDKLAKFHATLNNPDQLPVNQPRARQASINSK